jgi:hypothetical protein
LYFSTNIVNGVIDVRRMIWASKFWSRNLWIKEYNSNISVDERIILK